MEEKSPATEIESGFEATAAVLEYEVPSDELASVYDVSFSMWLKWNY